MVKLVNQESTRVKLYSFGRVTSSTIPLANSCSARSWVRMRMSDYNRVSPLTHQWTFETDLPTSVETVRTTLSPGFKVWGEITFLRGTIFVSIICVKQFFLDTTTTKFMGAQKIEAPPPNAPVAMGLCPKPRETNDIIEPVCSSSLVFVKLV